MNTYLELATLDGVDDDLEPGESNNLDPDPNWSLRTVALDSRSIL